MPAVAEYSNILHEVKERTVHFDPFPYVSTYENSFTFTVHSNVKDKDFLVKVEGVRNNTYKTKTDLHVMVRFQTGHCSILHNSQMFCTVKNKTLVNFLDNLITAEYGHVLNLVTMTE